MERNDQQEPDTGLTPHLTIRDRRAAEAIDFYKGAFGADELMRHASEDGRLMHAHLKVNGASLMMHDDFPEHGGAGPASEPAGVMLHLQVDDADAWWRRAVDAGAEVTMELADQFWGDRYGQIRDPFGHRWSIGSPVRKG
jgi:PhnB protein